MLQDFLGGVLDLCLATCSSITNAAVGRLTDAVAMVAPPGAERHKVCRKLPMIAQ
jgi:hypothetical protein